MCIFVMVFVCWAPFSAKVPVPYGERFEGGKVPEACENVGMKAVCFGDEGCSHDKDFSR